MPSRAEDLYQKIVGDNDPVAMLSGMVDSHVAEEEYLEFKGGKIQGHEQKVKTYWSEALSGFGNTEGGVLVWGVRANRITQHAGGRAIDCAEKAEFVPRPFELVQLLKDVHLAATVPPLRGVECRSFPADASGARFVVSLVREGQDKPYRADYDASKGYFQRVGDNFVPIPHSLLRSLFYPKARADITATVRVARSDPNSDLIDFFLTLGNSGDVSANEIMLIVRTDEPIDTLYATAPAWFSDIWTGAGGTVKQNQPGELQTFARRPLHPHQSMLACQARWQRIIVVDGHPFAGKELQGLTFHIGVYMANQNPSFFELRIDRADMQHGKVFACTPKLDEGKS